jgi:NADP-dependent 3-hydroxy acid dehydrogenase YdfG
MSKQVWLITGAGHGMGADLARAALAAGHSVVPTGRNADRIQKTLGESPVLLAVTLDVRSHARAVAAAQAAVDRFGRIGVLVNNAARGSSRN